MVAKRERERAIPLATYMLYKGLLEVPTYSRLGSRLKLRRKVEKSYLTFACLHLPVSNYLHGYSTEYVLRLSQQLLERPVLIV